VKLSPYNDPDYRIARAALKLNPQPCWFDDCTAQATTIDHVPAIAQHTHIRGTGCCELRPACRPHNCGSGASMGNAMREPHTPWLNQSRF
jgi:hypothetical protein